MGVDSGLFRTILFVINCAFTICGVATFAVGIYVCAGVREYSFEGFVVSRLVAIGLIVVGCIIFAVAFFGCYGTLRESRISLILYIVCVAVLCIPICLALGFMGPVTSSIAHAEDEIKRELENSLVNYNKNPPDAKLWDELQNSYKCCGVDDYQDWIKNMMKLPASCCTNEWTDTEGLENDLCVPHGKQNLRTRGCHDIVWKTATRYANVIFWSCIFALILQIMAIVLAIWLTVTVSREM